MRKVALVAMLALLGGLVGQVAFASPLSTRLQCQSGSPPANETCGAEVDRVSSTFTGTLANGTPQVCTSGEDGSSFLYLHTTATGTSTDMSSAPSDFSLTSKVG